MTQLLLPMFGKSGDQFTLLLQPVSEPLTGKTVLLQRLGQHCLMNGFADYRRRRGSPYRAGLDAFDKASHRCENGTKSIM